MEDYLVSTTMSAARRDFNAWYTEILGALIDATLSEEHHTVSIKLKMLQESFVIEYPSDYPSSMHGYKVTSLDDPQTASSITAAIINDAMILDEAIHKVIIAWYESEEQPSYIKLKFADPGSDIEHTTPLLTMSDYESTESRNTEDMPDDCSSEDDHPGDISKTFFGQMFLQGLASGKLFADDIESSTDDDSSESSEEKPIPVKRKQPVRKAKQPAIVTKAAPKKIVPMKKPAIVTKAVPKKVVQKPVSKTKMCYGNVKDTNHLYTDFSKY